MLARFSLYFFYTTNATTTTTCITIVNINGDDEGHDLYCVESTLSEFSKGLYFNMLLYT